jgi:hypothetical protein
MSERKKLEQNWELRTLKGEKISPATMIIELGKLVAQCSHSQAHWIQEINSEGVFSSKLFKRCYLCGYNIDELDVDPEFLEQILTAFDKSCEEKKALISKKEEAEQK